MKKTSHPQIQSPSNAQIQALRETDSRKIIEMMEYAPGVPPKPTIKILNERKQST